MKSIPLNSQSKFLKEVLLLMFLDDKIAAHKLFQFSMWHNKPTLVEWNNHSLSWFWQLTGLSGGSSHYEVEGTWWLGWSHTKDFLPCLAIDASCRLRSQWSVVGWGTHTKPFHLVWDSLLYGVWSPQRESQGDAVLPFMT